MRVLGLVPSRRIGGLVQQAQIVMSAAGARLPRRTARFVVHQLHFVRNFRNRI